VINENEHTLICTKCKYDHGGKTLEKFQHSEDITKQKINIKKIQKKIQKKKWIFCD